MTNSSNEYPPASEALSHQEIAEVLPATFDEIGGKMHTVQYSIYSHKIAMASLREVSQRRALTEDEMYMWREHSDARRRLHHRNHILDRALNGSAVLAYMQSVIGRQVI